MKLPPNVFLQPGATGLTLVKPLMQLSEAHIEAVPTHATPLPLHEHGLHAVESTTPV